MQNISKTNNNKAEADIKLNFNSYINRSNKAQKHEKTNDMHELNLTGSRTELFCNVVFVALCERQSVGDDQRTRHK
jgi:hypothetical protein